MGGGNFVVPVQTVTDFLHNKLSGRIAMPFLISFASIVQQAKLGSLVFFFPGTSVPPSSYRLGVKAANLHEIFPIHITETLQHSISAFDKEVLLYFSCNC